MPNERPKLRSNMRDVARYAGVSVATVSRVLSGVSKVSDTTRQKVDAAIEALNFVPSPAARSINSGRTYMVGALVPTLDHAIFARFLHVMEEEFALLGLSLVVATTGGDPDVEAKRAEDLMNLGVEGLIVSGLKHSPDFEARTERRQLPVIATSYFAPNHALPTIGYDNAAVARMAMDHLVSLGHRHITVLHGPVDTNDRTLARVHAMRASCPPETRFIALDFSYDVAARRAQDIVQDASKVTAFLCTSDVLALGALFGLQNAGIPVPDAVSIIGMEDLPASRTTSPALTSVRLPVESMGRKTARAMFAWVEEGARPLPEVLTGELILRKSTGPI